MLPPSSKEVPVYQSWHYKQQTRGDGEKEGDGERDRDKEGDGDHSNDEHRNQQSERHKKHMNMNWQVFFSYLLTKWITHINNLK